MSNAKLIKVSFRLPEGDLQEIDALIQRKCFPGRSDFFRAAVIDEIALTKMRRKQ